jgi:hypothetical protein
VNTPGCRSKSEQDADRHNQQGQGDPATFGSAWRNCDMTSSAREQTTTKLSVVASPAPDEVVPEHRRPVESEGMGRGLIVRLASPAVKGGSTGT